MPDYLFILERLSEVAAAAGDAFSLCVYVRILLIFSWNLTVNGVCFAMCHKCFRSSSIGWPKNSNDNLV